MGNTNSQPPGPITVIDSQVQFSTLFFGGVYETVLRQPRQAANLVLNIESKQDVHSLI